MYVTYRRSELHALFVVVVDVARVGVVVGTMEVVVVVVLVIQVVGWLLG